jgi:beta-glucanase (GH16 family)
MVVAFLAVWMLPKINSYSLVLDDTFADLNNWESSLQSGQSTGNNELQYYTDRLVNVYIGTTTFGRALQLKARKEPYMYYNYTSGKVVSKVKYGPYGFININALVPKGNGLWPALWLLPKDGVNVYGSWAACGEIDVLETICSSSAAYSTIHFGGAYPNNVMYPTAGQGAYPFSVDWTKPHYFGVEWKPDYLKFWFDAKIINGVIQGTEILTIPSNIWYTVSSNGNLTPPPAPFDVPTNIVMNLAVGGNWPCSVPNCCSGIQMPAILSIYNVQVWSN